MASDDEQSLSDGQTFDGGDQQRDAGPQSLGDEATFAGDLGHGGPQSLGDEVTFGGTDDDGEDAFDDGMEIVDLAARYTIEGTLGKGGMGEVLLATDTRLNRKVAIKRILGDAARSRTAVNRFLTEAQSIAALNHPNIVQIYDYGRAADGPFLIMEYVEGNSLLDLCSEGPLPLEEAVDLTCHLCEGLAKAHAAGIIHRDIKPANVLMTVDGVPKLTDFGLAKGEAADTGMTMAGAVLGTLDFMPPEQRKDAALTDARSDLWSLAATLYQMVTGKSPKIIRFNDVPQALQEVLGQALEDSKDDRYQTAIELRDALHVCLQDGGQELSDLGEGQCPHCGTKNDSSRKFCRNCAESMEVPCLSCTVGMPMWEKVCGSCGAKQDELLAERREQMAAEKAKAEACVTRHEYPQAIEQARKLGEVADFRLQHLKTWSEEFIADVEKQRDRELEKAANLLSESIQHEAAFDYPAGIKTLEQVPEAIRRNRMAGGNETVAKALERLSQKYRQCLELEKLIHGRIKRRNLSGLLPEVEKLLELVPNRPDLNKLKDQLLDREAKLKKVREKSYAEASKAFDSQDYIGCLAALSKIDPSLQDEEVRDLRDQTTEVNTRLKELSQQIDDAVAAKRYVGLLELIEEYLLLQREDTEMVKLRDQLNARAEKQAEQVAAMLLKARQLRSQCKFDEAVGVLSRIPDLLRNEEVQDLISECECFAYQRNPVIAQLKSALRSEEFDKSLNLASSYHSCISHDATLEDAEFRAIYRQYEEAQKRQREEREAAELHQAKMKKIKIGAGAGIAATLMLIAGLWGLSMWRASKLAAAMQRQDWDAVLAMDVENVAAIIGRANKRLSMATPDIDGAFADISLAEQVDSTVAALNPAKALAHAKRAASLATDGKLADAEEDLKKAVSLGVDADAQAKVKEALAEGFLKRGQDSARTGNVAAAEADYKQAQSYGAGSSLNALGRVLADAWLKRAEAEAVDNQGSEVSTALAKALSFDPNLKITAPVASVLAGEAVAAFEKDLGRESEKAALAAIGKLEETDGSATELPALRQRLARLYLQRAGSLAGQDPDSAARDLVTANSLDADSPEADELKGKIVTAIVLQAKDHLKAGDNAQGFGKYGLLAQLDFSAAANLAKSIEWGSLTHKNISESVTIRNSIEMTFRLIPPGRFNMGIYASYVGLARVVTLTRSFYLGAYEVTQDEYERVMRENPSKFKGARNPVEQVSWEDAVEFCRKLSAMPEEKAAGRVYRLPTEAEWERACRAGRSTHYSFGEDESQLGDFAWYKGNSNNETHPVGKKIPNRWMLYDMHGNVWEWCQDVYEYGLPKNPVTNPSGPLSGVERCFGAAVTTFHQITP